MSNVKMWAYINKTYNDYSRSAVIKKCFFEKAKIQRECWYYLAFYLLVSFGSLFFINTFFLSSILTICSSGFIAYYLLEKKLSRDLSPFYKKYNLDYYPLFERGRHLSYLLFKERLEKDNKLKASDIDSLLKWNEINNGKVDRMVFFRSKYMLMIVTALITLIVQNLLSHQLSMTTISQILVVVVVALVLFWFIFDFSNFTKDRQFNIVRFLKWYEIDN